MKEQFEIIGFSNNKDASYDINTISRFRNGFTGAIRDQVTLPKYLVVVPDNNIISYLKNKKIKSFKGTERVMKWLMTQMDRLITTQKERLPVKAKRPNEPTIIWISPPTHKNFKDNELREQFQNVLEQCCSHHNNTYTVKLIKDWSDDDELLFNRTDKKFTAAGYKTYWNAVDKAVKYVDTLLLKKEARKQAQAQSYKPKKMKSVVSIMPVHSHHRKHNDHNDRRDSHHQSSSRSYDRFHWTAKNRRANRH